MQALAKAYGSDLLSAYYDVINELIKEELLIGEGGVFLLAVEGALKPLAQNIKLSKRGIDISNQILSRFLLE